MDSTLFWLIVFVVGGGLMILFGDGRCDDLINGQCLNWE